MTGGFRTTSLEDQYDRHSISEGDGGMAVHGRALQVVDVDLSLCLVELILSNKQIKIYSICNVMPSTWRPVCGFTIKDI